MSWEEKKIKLKYRNVILTKLKTPPGKMLAFR